MRYLLLILTLALPVEASEKAYELCLLKLERAEQHVKDMTVRRYECSYFGAPCTTRRWAGRKSPLNDDVEERGWIVPTRALFEAHARARAIADDCMDLLDQLEN